MAGGLGGVLVQLLAGNLTDRYKATPEIAYGYMFAVCALAYIISWIVIKILSDRAKDMSAA